MTERYQLYEGDCLEVMRSFPDNHFSTCITDPPYGLGEHPDMTKVLRAWLDGEDYQVNKRGFMSKEWDVLPGPNTWKEVYRVLKPGGYALVFAGTRTYDLMTLALRLAGFRIVDCCMWLTGQGFPKALNISAAIDQHLGKEREAIEQSENARPNSNRGNGLAHGNYGQTWDITAPATDAAKEFGGWFSALKPAWEPVIVAQKNLSFVPNCDILHLVNQQIGGVICLQLLSVNDAEKVLRLNPHAPSEVSVFAATLAGLLHGNKSGELSAKMGMFNSPETVLTCLNIALSWNAILDGALNHGSTFTTRTEIGLTTGLKTLSCLLSPIIPESIILDVCPANGQPPLASNAGNNSSETPARSADTPTPFAVEIATLRTANTTLLASNAAKSLTPIVDAAGSVLSSVLTDIATASGQTELSELASIAAKPSSRYLHDLQPTATASAWQKLTPNFEPIIVAMKPLDGTYAANALAHGVAGLWVDGVRVGYEAADLEARTKRTGNHAGEAYGHNGTVRYSGGEVAPVNPAGRWPANLLLDQQAAALLDEQSGETKSSGGTTRKNSNFLANNDKDLPFHNYGDTGGASRYFTVLPDEVRFCYTAKASRGEREQGLDGLPEHDKANQYGDGLNSATKIRTDEQATNGVDRGIARNFHPTVKPLELMRWLVRLTKTPTGGGILDPFVGSGTTIVAALLEGRHCTGIDREAEYIQIARHRAEHWQDEASIEPRKITDKNADFSNFPLFAEVLDIGG